MQRTATSTNKRILGRTGIAVSELAFGGVEIGIPYGLGVSSKEHMLTKEQAIELLYASFEKGINFFDTARLYGESESIIGTAFAGIRKEIVIGTKCKHFRDASGQIPPYHVLKGIIKSSLEESLTALNTDYVDLFMLHQSDHEILENDDVARVFQECKYEKLIRATGASTYAVTESDLAIDKGVWDVIQLPFNLMDQQQAKVFKKAEQQGVAIVIRSVLLRGILSAKGRNLHPALHAVALQLSKYQQLLNDERTSLPALAMKFALSYAQPASILVGLDNQAYLEEAVKAANGKYLSPQDLVLAEQLAFPDPSFLNLPEWDRNGWLT